MGRIIFKVVVCFIHYQVFVRNFIYKEWVHEIFMTIRDADKFNLPRFISHLHGKSESDRLNLRTYNRTYVNLC